jgi:DNA-directed RNA polymerase I subunit RPA1
VQELYGGPVAGAITSALSRLLTTYIQSLGFTCGIADLLLTPTHEAARTSSLARAEAIAVSTGAALTGVALPTAAAAAVAGSGLLRAAEARVRAALRPRYRQNAMMGIVHDARCSSSLNPCASAVTASCFPHGLVRQFKENCMSLMTTSGAKGGLVNFSQITAMLGQQDLEGRRVPRMASGKTLPSFHAFDAGARSCGFVADRFLSGASPYATSACLLSPSPALPGHAALSPAAGRGTACPLIRHAHLSTAAG